MGWIALLAAFFVTTAGVAFAGPTGDGRCRDGPHPGIGVSGHWADDRTVPPVWACRYSTESGVVRRHELTVAVHGAPGRDHLHRAARRSRSAHGTNRAGPTRAGPLR